MKFSGVVWVGMENIIVNVHCKQAWMKKVVVSHGTALRTEVFSKKCCSLGLAWQLGIQCQNTKLLWWNDFKLPGLMREGIENSLVNFQWKGPSTKKLLYGMQQLKQTISYRVLCRCSCSGDCQQQFYKCMNIWTNKFTLLTFGNCWTKYLFRTLFAGANWWSNKMHCDQKHVITWKSWCNQYHYINSKLH